MAENTLPMNDLILWLVRHGETTWNAEHKISGWVDVQLSARGVEMAKRLRPLLEAEQFDAVHSSDLLRARHTGELALRSGVADARLRELDFGPLEGLNWLTMDECDREAVLAFSEDCTRGGETISAFEQRVFHFIEELNPGKHLLFVHGGLIRLVLRQVGADRFVPPTTVAVVNWTQRQLLALHLPEEVAH
jgi:probable phosphoglycerate mutase